MVHIKGLTYDVLDGIMSFLTGEDLTNAALVSRTFWLAVVPIIYQSIVFDDKLVEIYPKMASPFRAVKRRPEVALSVRVCGITALPVAQGHRNHFMGSVPPDTEFLQECIAGIKVCSKLVKFYIDPAVFAPFMYSRSISAMPVEMPPYLTALEGKDRLEDMRVNAFFSGRALTGQAGILTSLRSLRRVTLDFASTDVLDALPGWASSSWRSLEHIGFTNTPNLNPNTLSSVLGLLPNLTSLSIASCEGVDCISILRLLHLIPRLQSLAIMILDGEEIPSKTTYEGVKNIRSLTLSFPWKLGFPFDRATALLTNFKTSGAELTSLTICMPTRSAGLSHPFIRHIATVYGNSLLKLAFYGVAILTSSLPLICEQCVELTELSMIFPPGNTGEVAYAVEKAPKLHTLINTGAMGSYGRGWPDNALRSEMMYFMDVAQTIGKIITAGTVFERRTLDGREYVVTQPFIPRLGAEPDETFYSK